MLVADPAARRAIRQRWLLAFIFAFAGVWLFTRYAGFPFLYHPGERARADALLQKTPPPKNKPILLRRTTDLLVQLTRTPPSAQLLVEKGRLASALFGGVALGAIVLLAGRWAGRGAAIFAGLLALTHPVLFELSHYMEPDTAHAAGVAIALVALSAYGSQPSLWRAAVAGIGAGIAMSGQSIGVFTAGFVCVAIWCLPSTASRRWAPIAVAFASIIATYAVLNYPVNPIEILTSGAGSGETSPAQKRESSGIEFKHLHHIGTTLSVALLAGIAYWGWRRWRARRHETLLGAGYALFFIGYLLMISLSAGTRDTALLPIYLLACALGAAGMVEWARHYRRHRRSYTRGILRTVAVAALILHLVPLTDAWRAFKTDDRRELAAEIETFLVPESVIAHDPGALLIQARDAGLPGFAITRPLSTPPDPNGYVTDLGTIRELRARGITHVVVCETDYGRVARGGGGPAGRARQLWYEELFQQHRLDWLARPGSNRYLQPGLRLYELTP